MPVDDKTRDQSWKDWTRRDMQRSLHPQGPPTHLSQEELARPASLKIAPEHQRPVPTYGPLWHRQGMYDASRSRLSLEKTQQIDHRIATITATGPQLPGGAAYVSQTDNVRLYRPPPETPVMPPKKKMDALGESTGWQSAVPPVVPTAVYNPLTHNTHVVTRADEDGRGASVDVHRGVDVYRQMNQKGLSRDSWHGRRKGVATWEDMVHPFAVNQNKEYRQGFKHEPKPYHPVTGEMSAWMNNAFESKMKIPFTGKYPQ